MMHLDQKPMIVTGTQQDYYDPQDGTQGNYATVGSAIVAIAIVGRGG